MTSEDRSDLLWPYDWLRTENELDPKLIEHQGLFLLHRGLNIGRIIGFIGSGVTMAYGRVSWGELALVIIDGIVAAQEEAKAVALADRPPLAKMIERLKGMREEVAKGNGDDITLATHLAERIFMQVGQGNEFSLIEVEQSAFAKSLEAKFDLKSEKQEAFKAGLRGPELGHALFRKIVRDETYDETAHLRRLLSSAWRIPAAADGKDDIDTFADSLRNTGHDRFRHLPEYKRLRELIDSSLFSDGIPYGEALAVGAPPRDPAIALSRIVRDLLQQECKASGHRMLRPQRWYAAALLFDLLRLRMRSRAVKRTLNEIAHQLGVRRDQLKDESIPGERARVIPPEDDPLRHLAFGLRISRFATLNFDLELERLLQDERYQRTRYPAQEHLPESAAERFGPLGERARDFILSHDTIADFVDFAADDRPYEYQVVHLHGRATEGDDMVVTERDYQRMYIGDEPEHQAVGAGLDVMFGGNPILFAGVGMSEGDVLRPLREFAAGRARRNRSIIVLRNASRRQAQLDAFTLQQYVRYGVHTIHYGYRTIRDGDRTVRATAIDENGRIYTAEPWLHRLSTFSDELKKASKALADLCSGQASGSALTEKLKKLPEMEKQLSASWDQLEQAVDDGSLEIGKFESDGSPIDIRFELEILCHLSQFFTRLSQEWRKQRKKRYNPANGAALFEVAVPRAIDRATGAALTAALNARLQTLSRDWTDWWRRWRTPPLPRPVVFPQAVVNEARPRVDRLEAKDRRRVAIDELYKMRRVRHAVIEMVDDPRPSAALSAFLEAIPGVSDSEGRRLFAISAPRGAGKGSLFAELSRHADWILAGAPRPDSVRDPSDPSRWTTGAPDGMWHRPESRYCGYFMASFSFSTQITSVWDNLIQFLEASPDKSGIRASTIPALNDKSGQRSSGRIDRLRRAVDQIRKNATDMRAHLVERVGENVIGRYLIVLNGFDLLLHPNGEPKNAEIHAICGILLDATAAAPVDIIVLFRESIVPVYFRAPDYLKARGRSALYSGRHFNLLMSREDLEGDLAADRQAHILRVIQEGHISASPMLREIPAPLAAALPAHAPRQTAFYFRPLHGAYKSDLENTEGDSIRAFECFLAGRKPDRIIRSVNDLLRQRLRGSRYRLSMMLAVVRDMFALGIQERIDRLVGSIGRSAAAGAATDRFFEQMDQYWADRHATVSPEYAEVDKQAIRSVASICGYPGSADAERWVPLAGLPALQAELIRHLAVIAVPVTADVLVRAPRIADIVRPRSKSGPGAQTNDEEATSLVRAALLLACHRALVLMLQPEQSGKALEPRFTVHRSLQRHVYRKLGSQELEPADSFYFTVSTYASQTRELPVLSSNGYAFLNQLMDALIGYPSRSEPSRRSDDRLTDTRSLRAGLGVARTLYSIGVVSRFADLPGLERPDPPKIGYLEHHRLSLRWMIERARSIGREQKEKEGGGAAAPGHQKAIAEERFRQLPYYIDELAWLYNECGVFSLAQGQLHDAAALFSVAKILARRIEGEVTGPIGRRIRINSCLVALERGNLSEARNELSEIIRSGEGEFETLRTIAVGYQGLVSHVAGDHEKALEQYDTAIEVLEGLQRPRPVSIFLRHRGSLHRHMNNAEAAKADFHRAVGTASAAGFQDILWLARIEQADLEVREVSNPSDSARLIAILEEADRYADKMDVPRLTCQVMAVRATLALRQGETTRAAELATRALRIATLNGMTLRTISYRHLLSRVLDGRGRSAGSDRMRAQAQSMRSKAVSAARRVGYQLNDAIWQL